MNAAADDARLARATIAFPLQNLSLGMTDYGGRLRAWMSAYHGVRVDLEARRRAVGAGHFEFYRCEEGDAPGLGEIDRDGDDLSGDIKMQAPMFDCLAQAYVHRAAHEVWLSLYWVDPDGTRVLSDQRQTPVARIGLFLQPQSEAIL